MLNRCQTWIRCCWKPAWLRAVSLRWASSSSPFSKRFSSGSRAFKCQVKLNLIWCSCSFFQQICWNLSVSNHPCFKIASGCLRLQEGTTAQGLKLKRHFIPIIIHDILYHHFRMITIIYLCLKRQTAFVRCVREWRFLKPTWLSDWNCSNCSCKPWNVTQQLSGMAGHSLTSQCAVSMTTNLCVSCCAYLPLGLWAHSLLFNDSILSGSQTS